MATLLVQRNTDLLIFLKDIIMVYNWSNSQQKIINIVEPTVFNANHLKDLRKKRTIVTVGVSKDFQQLGIILDNKQMVIYDQAFNVLCNIITKRSCSSLTFTKDNDVVIADKTGDVYLYSMTTKSAPTLLLGHLSMVLDVAITNCGMFLISCDRDEKIRVSCFPGCYNIMSYCLGHREFVTNVKISGNALISASGDGTVRVWDFLNGNQLSLIYTNDYIEDKGIIHKFCKEMDDDRVDVQALPIVDLKVHEVTDVLTKFGVTLLNYSGVQIYDMEVRPVLKISIGFIEVILVESEILSFSLASQLFILTYNNIHIYSLLNNRYKKLNSLNLHQICNDHSLLEDKKHYSNYISGLYKRKYDNVQEYLARKKIRLGTKM